MRLNLSDYSCVFFRLNSEFRLAPDQYAEVQAVMARTSTHAHSTVESGEEENRVAIFGSRYRIRGTTYQSLGTLSRTRREDGFSIRVSLTTNQADDALPRPPRDIRPVSQLVKAAAELFGPVEINCTTVFEYDRTQGYESRVALPMPLVLPDEAGGITHIEGAEFSRRDNGDIQYRILITNPEDADLLVHSIVFNSTSKLSNYSARLLFEKARSISNRLLVTAGDN